MITPLNVLLVAGSAFDTRPLEDSLRRSDFEPSWTRVQSEDALRAELLSRPGPHIIVFDSSERPLDVQQALELAKDLAPDAPFIVIPEPGDHAPATATRAGDTDHVTERLRLAAVAVRELQQSAARRRQRSAERRFRSLIEKAPLGIVVHRDRRILYANPICLRYLRVDRLEDLLGRDPLELLAAADREQIGERIVRLHAGQSEPPMKTELLRADGTTVPIEVVGFPLDFDGGPAIVTLARDITVERDMQERLLIADRMASIGMLAAGIAHEMNNPLAYVHANIEFALERLTSWFKALSRGEWDAPVIEEVCEALREARQGASRARLIVRELKTFSGNEEERAEAIDLRPVVESAINIAFNEIRHRARLIKEYGPVPLVSANGARLGQVFLNLLVNAAQAIPEGAADRNQVRVSTATDELGRAAVAIADTGVGIPPEMRLRIFEPFFTTKPIGQGTGLGLTICQRIVSSLGGEIRVSSENGMGAEFCVVLPAAQSETKPSAPEVRGDQQESRRGRVLVIDDDPLLHNSIKRVLSMHNVVTELSGRIALVGLAAGERYDVILCDLMMPNMSGMEVHAELMKIDPGLAGRMVFLTGGTFTAAAQRFLDRVTNLRLEKPFNPADLRAIVRNQLGSIGSETSESDRGSIRHPTPGA